MDFVCGLSKPPCQLCVRATFHGSKVFDFRGSSSKNTWRRFSMDQRRILKLLKLQVVKASPPTTNGVWFTHVPKDYLEVAFSIDAPFALHGDKSSQLGIVALTRDNKPGPWILFNMHQTRAGVCVTLYLQPSCLPFLMVPMLMMHWSAHCRTFTTKKVDLTLYTGSWSLCGLCISLSQIKEQRLKIDLVLIREIYEKRDNCYFMYIIAKDNHDDGLTKPER